MQFAAQAGASDECSYERSFRLLAVAGPLLSFRDQLYIDCGGASPAIESRLSTLDLRRPGTAIYPSSRADTPLSLPAERSGSALASLGDYYSEAELLAALRAHPLLSPHLPQPVDSLAELASALKEQTLSVAGCGFYYPEDALSRFAFHDVRGERVAVRLALQPASTSCHLREAELAFLLPLPEGLKPALLAADSGAAGFLMQGAKKSTGATSRTRIAFAADGNEARP